MFEFKVMAPEPNGNTPKNIKLKGCTDKFRVPNRPSQLFSMKFSEADLQYYGV